MSARSLLRKAHARLSSPRRPSSPDMVAIRIEERAQNDGCNAAVSFDGSGEYPFKVADPFWPEEDEERLEWYFEEHLRFPFTDQVKAREAGESIKAYGEMLFSQVF